MDLVVEALRDFPQQGILQFRIEFTELLGGNTFLTPPVANTKSIGYVHSESITALHNSRNMTHHTHSMKSGLTIE
jgi:hypothetical protein